MRSESYQVEYLKCGIDLFHFLTEYCHTVKIDQATGQATIEKIPKYPYIRRFCYEVQEPCNVLVEKSRQMLLSWLWMGVYLHDLLFVYNFASFVTSKKQALVDDGGINSSWKSLFGKVRFMWQRLPGFLQHPLEFKSLRIDNPVTESSIHGESANVDSGRSGTYRRALKDEAAFIPKSESIFSSLSQACPNGMILNSTPNGKGNAFARIRFEVDTFKKIRIHWRQHPERNDDWYKRMCEKMTPWQVAQEIDIDYEKSVAGRVYADFDNFSQVRKLKIDKSLPTWTTWDFGIADPTAILFIQLAPLPTGGVEIRIVDEYENDNQDYKHFSEYVKAWGRKYGIEFAGHTGDPAGKSRGANKESWISLLFKEGIRIVFRYVKTCVERILTTRKVLAQVVVNEKCKNFIEAIANYKFPTDNEGNVIDDSKPEHNWASHIMTALEFFCVYKFPIRQSGASDV